MSVKVGFAGIGHMGLLHLFSCQKQKNNVEIVGVADKSKKRLKYCKKFNISTYDDYHELIDKEHMDCIIISLPNFLKKDCIEYAAENSLDIFLDKPLARNYQEAIEIYNQVRKNGIRLMVGTNYRYHPNVIQVKKLYNEGRIGDAYLANYELIMNGPFSHPLVPTPVSDWYLDPKLSGGGALLDLGYHLIDLAQWFFGSGDVIFSHIDKISNLPVEDSSSLMIKHKELGSISNINVGWFSKIIFPEFNFRVNVHGTIGYLTTDKYKPKNMRLSAIKEAIKNSFKKVLFQEINYLSYTYYYSSFYKMMSDFIHSIKTGADTPISLQEQVEVMRLIDEAYSNHLKKE